MDDPEISLRKYVETIIDLRHEQYKQLFEAMDAHMARALAAINERKHGKEWMIGNIISILVAVVAILIALWKR